MFKDLAVASAKADFSFSSLDLKSSISKGKTTTFKRLSSSVIRDSGFSGAANSLYPT